MLATLCVNTTADTVANDSYLSLREAIVAAGAGDTIDFSTAVFDGDETITLSYDDPNDWDTLVDPLPEIQVGLTIAWTGDGRITIAAANPVSMEAGHGLSFVLDSGTVEVDGLRIDGFRGSGIELASPWYPSGSCDVVIGQTNGCEITGNRYGIDVVAWNVSSLTIENCEIHGNAYDYDSSGISIWTAVDSVLIQNNKIGVHGESNSASPNSGAGIYYSVG